MIAPVGQRTDWRLVQPLATNASTSFDGRTEPSVGERAAHGGAPPERPRGGDPSAPVATHREALLLDALQCITGPGDAGRRGAARLLEHALRLGVRPAHLWCAVDARGRARLSALALPGPGRTAQVACTRPRSDDECGVSGRLVAAATGGLVPEEASVAQALLEPLDGAAGATAGPSNGAATTAGLVAALDEDRSEQALHVRAFLAAGFAPLAVLDTMVHVVTRRDAHPAAARDAARATIRPWTRGDPVLVRVLEASYEATRDCPGLCGLRRTEDIIAGHLASGRYEPSLWSILHVNGVPSGALLLGASHAGDGLDLIYLGLAAAVRGRGYGALLVEHAVRHAAARREPRVCLAVDRANTPAVRLYERFGFRATTSRLAMIRRVRALDPPRDDASPRSQGADDQSR